MVGSRKSSTTSSSSTRAMTPCPRHGHDGERQEQAKPPSLQVPPPGQLHLIPHLHGVAPRPPFSWNLLAQRSAEYLCSARVPGSEAQPLAVAATALGVQVAVLPDQGVKDLQVHVEGDRKALMAHPALLLATNGALRQRADGGGIVFDAPGAGVVLRAWLGCLV